MNKAVFLDRDGVLNKEVGDYVTKANDFELLEQSSPLLKRLQDAGYLLIVVTNQGGIAKSLYTHDELKAMHVFMENEFLKNKIELTEIFYCPHHPDFSKCLCRKPGSLMIEKALAKYEIDPAASFLIGDRDRDIEAANGAGVKGYLVQTNESWNYVVDEILKNKI